MATKPKTPGSSGTAKKAKPAATAKQKADEVAGDGKPEAASDAAKTLRGRDLVSAVTAATGAKKTLVRDIVTATLAAMGDALAAGQTLNLPPLGKAHVSRSKERGSNELLVIKLRRGGSAKPAKDTGKAVPAETLADPAD